VSWEAPGLDEIRGEDLASAKEIIRRFKGGR